MSRPTPIMVLQEAETMAAAARTMIDNAFMSAWLRLESMLCKLI